MKIEENKDQDQDLQIIIEDETLLLVVKLNEDGHIYEV